MKADRFKGTAASRIDLRNNVIELDDQIIQRFRLRNGAHIRAKPDI